MTNSPQLSKTLGALLGVHAGDSLGATLEFHSWEEIHKAHPSGIREIVGGGPFQWPVGHATDDTDLTRAVLLAYHDQSHAPNPAEFDVVRAAANHSLDWLTGNWPERSPGERPVDIGGATSIGLSNYQRSRDPKTCGAGTGSAGNGSLMRCIPTALFVASSAQRIADSMAISAFTHNDASCKVSCAAYNEMVAALVAGKSPDEAVDIGIRTAEDLDSPVVARAISKGRDMSLSRLAERGPGKELPKRASGWVLESLSVAVAALVDQRSFENCLVDVVRVGADTDTNAAIAGGLLGAREGVEGIPERWVRELQFGKEFVEIARGLLEK